VRPAVNPPEPPATERNQYIIFYGHAQMGLNFPLSPFLKAVLDFYGVKVNDLTPNSMLMLATFAYLCEAFVGVPPSVTLWRHFFTLQAKGKGQVFGGLSFQRRRNPRTKYLPSDFEGKWENWRQSWAYITLEEPEPRMEVPHGVPKYDIDESNIVPEMHSEWAPVLKRISDLGEQGLHTTMLLSDFIWRRFAPLRENPKRFWAYTGPNDTLKVSNTKPTGQQVLDFLRGCVHQRSDDRIGMPDHLRMLFENQRTRGDILRKMPRVNAFGLVSHPGDHLMSRLDPALVLQPEAAPMPQSTADRGKRKGREGTDEGSSSGSGPTKVARPEGTNPFAVQWGSRRGLLR
jgi:hypothetical protein